MSLEPHIVLKKHFKDDRYLGMEVVFLKDLTPEYLATVKADTDDKLGWKRHRKVMKEAGFDIDLVEAEPV